MDGQRKFLLAFLVGLFLVGVLFCLSGQGEVEGKSIFLPEAGLPGEGSQSVFLQFLPVLVFIGTLIVLLLFLGRDG